MDYSEADIQPGLPGRRDRLGWMAENQGMFAFSNSRVPPTAPSCPILSRPPLDIDDDLVDTAVSELASQRGHQPSAR